MLQFYFNPDGLYCGIDLLCSCLRSFYKPWRLIPFACGSTKCIDIDNLRTAVTKNHNPTVDVNVTVIQDCSRPHDGAIYNKVLQEDFSDSDLDDCTESKSISQYL